MRISTTPYVILVVMALTAMLTYVLHPDEKLADGQPTIQYGELIPSEFGPWRERRAPSAQIINPQLQASASRAYDQTISRVYVRDDGYMIMLSLAYGASQRGNLQLHHPELCYPAQGFSIRSNRTATIETGQGILPVRRLESALNNSRLEPVTYWSLIGGEVALGSVSRKLIEMRHGFQGQISDGLLFRISSIDRDSANAFMQQSAFVSDLVSALPRDATRRLTGL